MSEISFILTHEQYKYPCLELYQQFKPEVQVVFDEMRPERITMNVSEGKLSLSEYRQNQMIQTEEYTYPREPLSKENFKRFLYLFLSKSLDMTLDWGLLTGIKPVKLAHAELLKDANAEHVMKTLQEHYLASPEKIALITKMAKREMPFVYQGGGEKVSLYIGIPLCMTKCSYCSFISTIVDKKRRNVAWYVENLIREIEATGLFFKGKGIVVDTVYIGGGTPSVLLEDELRQLLEALKAAFDFSNIREFTFEAGRPETTDIRKLELLKKEGVDRLCLNPQSMNADTLKAVGRPVSPESIRETFHQMHGMGFENINMDLILGLNHEAPEKFMYSLDQVIEMVPAGITVHCLALKKGSEMRHASGRHVENLYSKDFCDTIGKYLEGAGYAPYYLYRQKYTQGNGENIGYCREGQEGIYNILMMAERQSIIGLGAGSSGKLYNVQTNRFDKIFTVKDVKTYNERTDEIIEKKLAGYREFYGD